MRVLVISPHLDDGALSCGATISSHSRRGAAVTVVTVFAGAPGRALSPLARRHHARWGVDDAVAARRKEDLTACRRLGTASVHLDFPDAIYRATASGDPRYRDEEELFCARLDAADTVLARTVAPALARWIGGHDVVYAPRALGGHVDHVIVRRAVEDLVAGGMGARLLLYEDMPYALTASAGVSGEDGEHRPALCEVPVLVEARDWRRKIRAIRAYGSQQAMLWRDRDWAAALREYALKATGGLGERMWQRGGAIP